MSSEELLFGDRVRVLSLNREGTVTGWPLNPYDERMFVHLDGDPLPKEDDPEAGTLFALDDLLKVGEEGWVKRYKLQTEKGN